MSVDTSVTASQSVEKEATAAMIVVQWFLYTWFLFFFLVAAYAYQTHMPKYVKYVLYANPKNEMNEKLFLEVLQKMSYVVKTQNFPKDVIKVLQSELNKYYVQYFQGLQEFDDQLKEAIVS